MILTPEYLIENEIAQDVAEAFDISYFITKMLTAYKEAKAKYPHTELKTTALCSEAGEVATAVLREPWHNVLTESAQLAALAMRLSIAGDSSAKEYRARYGLDFADHPNPPKIST